MVAPVSVVIPTYNRANLITETLEAVIGQTERPAEIIVVDDGSVDDTEAVINRFGNGVRYIKVVNGGPPRARNIGARAATQPWIAFCDSDDIWRPTYVAAAMELVAKAPQCRFIIVNFVLFCDGVWEAADKFSQAPKGWWDAIALEAVSELHALAQSPLYPSILRFQPIRPSGMVLTREYFEEIGGCDESFGRNKCEDTEFILRCVEGAPVGIIRPPLFGLRRHAGNFTHDDLGVTLGKIEVLDFAARNHNVPEPWREILRDEIVHLTVAAFDGAFARGDMKLTRSLSAGLPHWSLTFQRRLKKFIVFLPAPLNGGVTRWIQSQRPVPNAATRATDTGGMKSRSAS